jgi:TRAP-type C4-dicarboxylate transport system substrate-binding protein
MTKKIWVTMGSVLLILVGLVGWLFSPYFSSFVGEPVQLKIGWTGPNDSGVGQAVSAYVGDLKEKDSSVEISLYPLGRLGEKGAVLDAVRVGQPYLAFMLMDEAARYSDKGKVLSLPLLFKDNNEVDKFMGSSAYQSLNQDLNAKGFQVIGWLSGGNDSLWLEDGKTFPKNTQKLMIATTGYGIGENIWKEFNFQLKPLPAGIWQSENLTGTVQGILTSSEWILGKGFFTKRPYRIAIGGVKPVFLVMNRELFLSLPMEEQQKLMDATKIWNQWNPEKIEKINFDKMAGQREISTFMIPETDYPYLARVQARGLTKDQLIYLEEIRQALGGLFFYEPRPEAPRVRTWEAPSAPQPAQPAVPQGGTVVPVQPPVVAPVPQKNTPPAKPNPAQGGQKP